MEITWYHLTQAFLIRWPPNSCYYQYFGEEERLGWRGVDGVQSVKKKKKRDHSFQTQMLSRQDHQFCLLTYSPKTKFSENYFDRESILACKEWWLFSSKSNSSPSLHLQQVHTHPSWITRMLALKLCSPQKEHFDNVHLRYDPRRKQSKKNFPESYGLPGGLAKGLVLYNLHTAGFDHCYRPIITMYFSFSFSPNENFMLILCRCWGGKTMTHRPNPVCLFV